MVCGNCLEENTIRLRPFHASFFYSISFFSLFFLLSKAKPHTWKYGLFTVFRKMSTCLCLAAFFTDFTIITSWVAFFRCFFFSLFVYSLFHADASFDRQNLKIAILIYSNAYTLICKHHIVQVNGKEFAMFALDWVLFCFCTIFIKLHQQTICWPLW